MLNRNGDIVSDKRVFLYKYTFENKEDLKASNDCVCLYCKNKIKFKEIKEWITDVKNDTALCPNCGVDAIIPLIINEEMIDNETIDFLHTSHFE